jgi:SAM-dependent methyltransferase
MKAGDRVFTGSVPKIYERYLVPLIFEPYAADLAERLATRSLRRVLELAAGTGVVTRRLAAVLPADVEIVATDLNPPMIAEARSIGTPRPVEWRQADALQLPFPDRSFDAVVCQFGCMFFSDKARSVAEARRVLRPGGVLIYNAWDRIEENEFADVVTNAVAALFPGDPPRFLARTPYGYNDRSQIERDVLAGGGRPTIETVAARSRAPSHEDPAIGFVQGTPLRNEVEARDPTRLAEATEAAAEAVARRFGRGPVEAKMQALVVTVEA